MHVCVSFSPTEQKKSKQDVKDVTNIDIFKNRGKIQGLGVTKQKDIIKLFVVVSWG
jgi:hypothetical protein